MHTREDLVLMSLVPQGELTDCIGYNSIVDRAEYKGYGIEKVGNNLG